MDLLTKQNGTTLLESLVIILLLGILLNITASFFNMILNNNNMLKTEALQLAQQEIERTISQFSEHDTIYLNESGNLKVRRIVFKNENKNLSFQYLYNVEVSVSKSKNDSLIILLKTIYNK